VLVGNYVQGSFMRGVTAAYNPFPRSDSQERIFTMAKELQLVHVVPGSAVRHLLVICHLDRSSALHGGSGREGYKITRRLHIRRLGGSRPTFRMPPSPDLWDSGEMTDNGVSMKAARTARKLAMQ